jgi:hypothetical protein
MNKPVIKSAAKTHELLDALYTAGYEDAKKEKDYDPRGCKEWQDCVYYISSNCEAIQYSCQTICHFCRTTWDTNDECPPACRKNNV